MVAGRGLSAGRAVGRLIGRSLRGKLTFVLDKKRLWKRGRERSSGGATAFRPAGRPTLTSRTRAPSFPPIRVLSSNCQRRCRRDRHRDGHKTTASPALPAHHRTAGGRMDTFCSSVCPVANSARFGLTSAARPLPAAASGCHDKTWRESERDGRIQSRQLGRWKMGNERKGVGRRRRSGRTTCGHNGVRGGNVGGGHRVCNVWRGEDRERDLNKT